MTAGPASQAAAAHVFVADLADPVLAPDDDHHLRRVLRLQPGADLTIADGAGRWCAARLGDAAHLEPVSGVVVDPEPAPVLTVGFALVKGERPEWVVQKLTEIGVDRIVPFAAARSVVRWDEDRSAHHALRFAKVARQAAMQCRRSRLPVVEMPTTFAAAAGRARTALAAAEGEAPTLDLPSLLTGPEGGWSATERAAGLPMVALGPNVLRAETAAIVAGTLLVALRTGLVAPHAG